MKQILTSCRQENKHCVVKELKSMLPLRCFYEISAEMSGSITKHLFHFILVAINNGNKNVSLKKKCLHFVRMQFILSFQYCAAANTIYY